MWCIRSAFTPKPATSIELCARVCDCAPPMLSLLLMKANVSTDTKKEFILTVNENAVASIKTSRRSGKKWNEWKPDTNRIIKRFFISLSVCCVGSRSRSCVDCGGMRWRMHCQALCWIICSMCVTGGYECFEKNNSKTQINGHHKYVIFYFRCLSVTQSVAAAMHFFESSSRRQSFVCRLFLPFNKFVVYLPVRVGKNRRQIFSTIVRYFFCCWENVYFFSFMHSSLRCCFFSYDSLAKEAVIWGLKR